MSMISDLSRLLGDAFAAAGLARTLGEVVVSSRPELAQFQCNGALPGGKAAGRPPREVAEEVAARLAGDPRLADVSVAGPGFINLTVADPYLAGEIASAAADGRYGLDLVADPLTVVVDYAGPNVAKAMHVGHIRATIIGDALARIFAFAGHTVIRDPHFGDWGLQMGLLIAAIGESRPDLPYFAEPVPPELPASSPVTLDDLQRLYPEAAARAQVDDAFAERARRATVALQQGHPGYLALWRHMKDVSLASQRRDFADLGVEFDLWYGESDVADRIPAVVERFREAGLAVESEGALVVPVAEPGDSREWPPLILETSVGGYLYSTTDLATIDFRVAELGADLVLYVVDARQSDHFEQVFRAARRGGLAGEGVALEHIKFGTMNGKDGRPFKTREGGVVRLRDLLDMVTGAAAARLAAADIAQGYGPEERTAIAHAVGIAALKFADLQANRTSDYVFDLDRFTAFEGKTGPYLQYGAVRMKSILRNAAERGFGSGTLSPPATDAERQLLLGIARFPEVVLRSLDLRAPHHVAEYAFDLVGSFNRFYDTSHILSEPDPDRRGSWLRLVEIVLSALTRLLDLLGIAVPERM